MALLSLLGECIGMCLKNFNPNHPGLDCHGCNIKSKATQRDRNGYSLDSDV